MKPDEQRSLYEVQSEIHRIVFRRLSSETKFDSDKYLNVLRELSMALKENDKLKAEIEQLQTVIIRRDNHG